MTVNEAKKVISKHIVASSIERGFKRNGLYRSLDKVYARTAALLEENSEANKALYNHLEQMLPCIAFYEALKELTSSKEEALAVFEKWAFIKIQSCIPAIQTMMKTGLYKKIPEIGAVLLEKTFNEEAGFESRSVETDRGFAVDMTVCPYLKTCEKYGCPELTQMFCKSDDVLYGNLHPNLVWGRTQTLGMGGECCDFRLYLKEE